MITICGQRTTTGRAQVHCRWMLMDTLQVPAPRTVGMNARVILCGRATPVVLRCPSINTMILRNRIGGTTYQGAVLSDEKVFFILCMLDWHINNNERPCVESMCVQIHAGSVCSISS